MFLKAFLKNVRKDENHSIYHSLNRMEREDETDNPIEKTDPA